MKILINFFLFIIISNNAVSQKNNLFLYNNRYIYIKGDTAYYELRVIDKPDYFIDYDTLIISKLSKNRYNGKNAFLVFENGYYKLFYTNRFFNGKNINFVPASQIQYNKWCQYHKISAYIDSIRTQVKFSNK